MINKAFNTSLKSLGHWCSFKFCSKPKIYEGMVLSQRLKYTLEDNMEYRKLCLGNSEQNKKKVLKKQQFVDRMLLSSIFSRIIGSNLTMSIYLSQKVQILKDLPLNEQIEGRVQIAKDLGKDKYLLITEVVGKEKNGEREKYVTGQARIMLRT